MKLKTIQLPKGRMSRWDRDFIHLPSGFQSLCPQRSRLQEGVEFNLSLGNDKVLDLSSLDDQHLGHCLQVLVAAQADGEECGFLPTAGCRVLMSQKAYCLEFIDDEAEHEYGWFLVEPKPN